MDFFFGNLIQLSATTFKKVVDDAQTKLGGNTPVFFFSSHDHSRQWSTFGDGTNNDQIAKLTAALTLTQRGTVLLYYGEEIGMANMSDEMLKEFPLGPKRPRADDRDRCRTPMQWTPDKRAGFTNGDPWLPIQRAAQNYNVDVESQNPTSVYSWYKNLLRLRREHPAFRAGAYLPLETDNPNVYAFARITREKAGAVVVLSTSGNLEHIKLTGLPDKTSGLARILLASPDASVPATLDFVVSPYGVLIAALADK
jgi:alpha-glucosidase